MVTVTVQRRLPVGAEVTPQGVHFRVWAPRRQKVEVVIETGSRDALELENEGDGYYSLLTDRARAGTLYRFRLDGSDYLYPDPVSRFQPQGPHGPSCIVDPGQFNWTDANWRGLTLKGQIIYELHIGTFTREGSWQAAMQQLPELADAGITVIEMMPVAEFPGRFGWGYDGVDLFAPSHLYGQPDDLRSFVDRAHALGLAVILDVVYNHLGPDGNYLKQFCADYFTDRYENEWGDAINFDGQNAAPVREFFIANARYWIDEFHMDGLRLDATQQIFDHSDHHILAEISSAVREAARGRNTILVAENEPQHVRMVKPIPEGGHGLDGLWNDDFQHSAAVVLTGHNEAYYTDYLGRPQEFVSLVKWGYLYQGQRYKWQQKRRGTPTFGLAPETFVNFIENHDQVANSARGQRTHQLTSPGRYRAMVALMLLAPGTPMLFQGQEFAASSPFLYFADHNPELAPLVGKGRAEFLSQFPSIKTPEISAGLKAPEDPDTYERCKLDFSEREKHKQYYDLYRDLLRLRRSDPLFSAQRAGVVDGAVLGDEAFLLRYFASDGNDRLLLVNFGRDLHLDPAPEPLLAPPENQEWRILWSSEDPRYGGGGTPALETDATWRVPGQAAVVLIPAPMKEAVEEENERSDSPYTLG